MLFHPDEKLAIFIDGSNLFSTVKALNIDIDYSKLRRYFADRCRLLRVNYYTALVDDAENSPLRPLVDWLDYNGYTMITKPAKEFIDEHGERKIKGNMDVELAVDMIDMAKYVDHMVLFSGDGDFRSLVEALQRKGVRVSVISSTKTRPSMIADELRRQADSFVEILDLTKYFTSNGAPSEIRSS
ncbi:MAG: NYN domain-containing protein [Kordiimonadaceae bacterium]|jgi:uncharacterized LabA/DUF88 family protein|nr:NYN domain-containing protein [Kordiimonadaceae bacterium]MBT7543790.1 NYN domain-containing protein [Kordiimonadaceae bacterium]